MLNGTLRSSPPIHKVHVQRPLLVLHRPSIPSLEKSLIGPRLTTRRLYCGVAGVTEGAYLAAAFLRKSENDTAQMRAHVPAFVRLHYRIKYNTIMCAFHDDTLAVELRCERTDLWQIPKFR